MGSVKLRAQARKSWGRQKFIDMRGVICYIGGMITRFLPLIPMACALLGAPANADTLLQEVNARFAADTVQVNPANRAALQNPELAALGLIPADAEAYAVLPCDTLVAFMRDRFGMTAEDDVPRSYVVAAGKGTAEALSCAVTAVNAAISFNQLMPLSYLAATDGSDEDHVVPDVVYSVCMAARKEQMEKISGAVGRLYVAPLYLAFTTAEGRTDRLYDRVKQTWQELIESGSAMPVDVPGFDGCKMKISKSLLRDLNIAGVPGVQDREFYLLSKKHGAGFVAILCEDPAAVRLPECPEESLLNTDKVQIAEAHPSGLVAAGWLSREVGQALLPLQDISFSYLGQTVAKVFAEMSTKDAANKAVYDDAAAALGRISKWHITSHGPCTQPTSFAAWLSGKDMLAEIRRDSLGAQYLPGHLRSLDLTAKDDTVFYWETTGCSPAPTFIQEGMVDDVLSLLKGGVLIVDEYDRDDLAAIVSQYELYLPEIKQMLNNLQQLDRALETPVAIVVASPDDPEDPVSTSIAYGVKNRADISAVWDATLTAAEGIAMKNGMTPEQAKNIVSAGPIISRAKPNNVMTHSLRVPQFSMAGIEPTVALTDTAFAVGTHERRAEELAAAHSGAGVPFAGSVLSLNIAALVPMLDYACYSEIEVPPAEEVEIDPETSCAEKDGGVVDTEVVESDYETCESGLSRFAKVFSHAYILSTVEDGSVVIRIMLCGETD